MNLLFINDPADELLKYQFKGVNMATTIGVLTGKPRSLKQWAEISLVGVGLIGLFVLVVILYLGLAF
jgi:hypothetical protein